MDFGKKERRTVLLSDELNLPAFAFSANNAILIQTLMKYLEGTFPQKAQNAHFYFSQPQVSSATTWKVGLWWLNRPAYLLALLT